MVSLSPGYSQKLVSVLSPFTFESLWPASGCGLLDLDGDMTTDPVGLVVRYARSFYETVANRRKFERLPFSGAISATLKGLACETEHHCNCVDICLRGIAMDCPEPLLPDMIVHLHLNDGGVNRLARVRHCRPLGSLFRVGLEFLSGTPEKH
jgi:hypothetical protein